MTTTTGVEHLAEVATEALPPPAPGNSNKKDDNNNNNNNIDQQVVQDSTTATSTTSNIIGSGPLFRRTVIRRRVIRGNNNMASNKKKKKKAVCFNWLSLITCLITMEAIALIFLVFRSQTILIDPSLEEDTLHLLVWLDTKLGGGGEQDREELEQLEAFLVQRTEDRLDHGHLLEHEVEKVAIDNYYQREHYNFADLEGQTKPPTVVLLVAGVQGSGSRAVVDALVQLNIPMITLDHPPPPAAFMTTQNEKDKKTTHMGQIAWREMINIVLQAGIRSSNYEFRSLPKFSQLRLQQQWEKFYQGYIAKQIVPETRRQQQQQQQQQQNHQILYGFQAHDGLFLLPVFQEFMVGPLKVIQIVRDGRDVALLNSKPKIGKDNREHPMHSMAERFVLETYYEVSNITKSYDDQTNLTFQEQSMLRSMELWNDWNRDALVWLEEHGGNNNGNSNSNSNSKHLLDYLQLRTEDLLSPEKKFEALLELSHFTGAGKGIPFEKLCCLSRQSLVIEKSDEYLKSFERAKAQHDVLNRYSAQLSFLHQEMDEEEERRKARLGDLIVDNDHNFPKRRHPGPAIHPLVTGDNELRKEIHHHRKKRFEDIGDRLAARMPANPAEGRRRQRRGRRLLEEEGKEEEKENNNLLIAKPLLVVGDESKEGGSTSGGQGRIKSPEVKEMFKQYLTWRKSLPLARDDPEAAEAAIERGEQLLEEYHKHKDHLKGVLTEDSFTRSIHWLKNLHTDEAKPPPPPPNHISHRYGKWAQVLREQPQLAQRLNTVGNETLQLFGYEPHMRFIDFDPDNRKAKCRLEMCNQ